MLISRLLIVCALIGTTSGCAQALYQHTRAGELTGRLIVEWVEPDQFIYRPDATNPLTFTTFDKRVIIPRTMATDGGSIPRLFWGVPGFSPWGLAPGYIIHDWLFVQHHCKYDDYESVSFDDSARILAEAIKTQMKGGKAPESAQVLYAVYEAVSSPIARSLWERGQCAPRAAAAFTTGARVRIMEIDFGPLKK